MKKYKQYISKGNNKIFNIDYVDTNIYNINVLINGKEEEFKYNNLSSSIELLNMPKKGDYIEIYTLLNSEYKHKEKMDNMDIDFVKTISTQINNLEKSLKEYTNININNILINDYKNILDKNIKKLEKYNIDLQIKNEEILNKIRENYKKYEDYKELLKNQKKEIEELTNKKINEIENKYKEDKVFYYQTYFKFINKKNNETFSFGLNKNDSFNIYRNGDIKNETLLSIEKNTGDILPGFKSAQSLGNKNKPFKNIELSDGIILKSLGDEDNISRFFLTIKDNGEIITKRIDK